MLSAKALLRLALMCLLALPCLGASCGQTAVGLMPGVVNNPANRSLRRAIFSYVTDSLCSEIQRSSVPLKLRDADPTIGRFFPQSCAVRTLANENLFVQLMGHGYAWTNVTGRIGFDASIAVEYDHDFLMDGSTMYVYFRQKQTQQSEFRLKMVEKSGTVSAPALTGMMGMSAQDMAQQVGNRILQSQLARGFTVIRDSDGETAFALGVVEQGDRPPVPFERGDSNLPLLANDRSEIHSQQRDFAGPFRVTDRGQALFLTGLVEGAPTVDVIVVDQRVGDAWLTEYETAAATAPPRGNPLLNHALMAPPPIHGRPLVPWRQQLRLPPGAYYLVFDNTSTAGNSMPANRAGDDRAALVSYAVQLGDAE